MTKEEKKAIQVKELTLAVVEKIREDYYLVPKISSTVKHDKYDIVERAMHFVAQKEGVNPSRLKSKSQERDLVDTRGIIYYILRRSVKEMASFQTIGRFFYRDHSTVINGIKQVENLMYQDVHFKGQMNEYVNEFKSTYIAEIEQLKKETYERI